MNRSIQKKYPEHKHIIQRFQGLEKIIGKVNLTTCNTFVTKATPNTAMKERVKAFLANLFPRTQRITKHRKNDIPNSAIQNNREAKSQ